VGDRGHVYANDIVQRALNAIQNQCEQDSIENITTVRGEVDDPLFPESELDMIVMVYAFHDFARPVDWLIKTKKYLKPGATVVIIDRDPQKYGYDSGHFMTKEEILKAAENADYELLRIETFLTRENIYIFLPRIAPPGLSETYLPLSGR
jgi:ubiquinone/menaquinone biosynthesis C-methylase UbiE